MSDTPTPMTESAAKRIGWGHGCGPMWTDFARQLERELAEANERIRRLEEAGDAFVSADSAEQYVWAEESWTKAKEAKA